MTAARDGDCEEVQRLLDDQQWPAAVLSRFGQASGYTALGLACNRGHIEVALLLLERGADPNVLICEAGATPLMIAVVWNRAAIVAMLLQYGAEIDTPAAARQAGPYDEGTTALAVARQRGRTDAVKLIITERARRRFRRLRRAVFLFGHSLLAFAELWAQVHFRPGGDGAKDASREFHSLTLTCESPLLS